MSTEETGRAVTFERGGTKFTLWLAVRVPSQWSDGGVMSAEGQHFATAADVEADGFVPKQQLADAERALGLLDNAAERRMPSELTTERDGLREQLTVANTLASEQRAEIETLSRCVSDLNDGCVELEKRLAACRSVPTGDTQCPQCGANWPHHHTRDGFAVPSKPSPAREEKDSSPSPGAPDAGSDSGAEKPREVETIFCAAPDSPGDEAGATKEAQPAEGGVTEIPVTTSDARQGQWPKCAKIWCPEDARRGEHCWAHQLSPTPNLDAEPVAFEPKFRVGQRVRVTGARLRHGSVAATSPEATEGDSFCRVITCDRPRDVGDYCEAHAPPEVPGLREELIAALMSVHDRTRNTAGETRMTGELFGFVADELAKRAGG